jgi:hypothetical protein
MPLYIQKKLKIIETTFKINLTSFGIIIHCRAYNSKKTTGITTFVASFLPELIYVIKFLNLML